jgi:hypothetical protein
LRDPLSPLSLNVNNHPELDPVVSYSEWLAPQWREPSLQFVHEALEQYLIDHHPELTNWHSSRQYCGPIGSAFRLSFATIREVVSLLHIPPAMVWRLALLGDLTLVDAPPHCYYRDQLVRRHTVWEVRRAWQIALSRRDATRWQGLSDDVLSDFARAGLLRTGTRSDQDSPELFSRQAIADLWLSLDRRARTVLTVTPELLELRAAADLVKRIGQNAAHLVIDVMRDQLQVYCQGPMLSAIDQLLFSKRDIRVHIAQHLNRMKQSRIANQGG